MRVLKKSNKLRYDVLATNINISNVSYTTIYNYDGFGILYGFYIETEKKENKLEVVIDSSEIIITNLDLSDVAESKDGTGTFVWGVKDSKKIYLQFPQPIVFESKIEVKLKGEQNNKDLRNGYIVLTKEA